jgi:hypothetical protein
VVCVKTNSSRPGGQLLAPGTPKPPSGLLELTVDRVEEPTVASGELLIRAERNRRRVREDPDAVLSDRFYADQLPIVVVSSTGVEMDHAAAFRRWRPAEFLEWLDAVRPYVAEAVERDRDAGAFTRPLVGGAG